jgi:hypothetical protein
LKTFDENNENNVELADSYQKLGNNYDHLGWPQEGSWVKTKILGNSAENMHTIS